MFPSWWPSKVIGWSGASSGISLAAADIATTKAIMHANTVLDMTFRRQEANTCCEICIAEAAFGHLIGRVLIEMVQNL